MKRSDHLKVQKTQLAESTDKLKNSFAGTSPSISYILNYLKNAHERRDSVRYTPQAVDYLKAIKESMDSLIPNIQKVVVAHELLDEIIEVAETKVNRVVPKRTSALEDRIKELETRLESLTQSKLTANQ